MKTAIVTGAYGAIGKAIALGLAKETDMNVIMVGRDEVLLTKAVQDVIQSTGNKKVNGEIVDLSLLRNIHDLSARIQTPVHILVNNASTTPRLRTEADDGTELQWAVNVLAYYRIITELMPQIEAAKGARIVNVASYWAGGLDLKDPEFKYRTYNNDTAYRQSKQADRMLTKAFSDLRSSGNITVNACHPGDVNSKLSNNLGFGGHETPDQGADTPLWLALSKDMDGLSGRYFEHRSESVCSFMKDIRNVHKLFEICSH